MRELADEGQVDLGPVYDLLDRMMLFSDPPKHTRLRGLEDRRLFGEPPLRDVTRLRQAVLEPAGL